MAIEQYRLGHLPESGAEETALGPEPIDGVAAWEWRDALRTIEETCKALGREPPSPAELMGPEAALDLDAGLDLDAELDLDL